MPLQIRDLRPGLTIKNAIFLLAALEQRRTKTGKPYLHVQLTDTTGRINGLMWVLPAALDDLVVGAGVATSGDVETYQDQLQIKLTAIVPAVINPQDYLPTSIHTPDDLSIAVEQVISEITDKWLLALLQQVFTPSFLPVFCRAPGGKAMHHARLGGLAEHSLAIAALAEAAAAQYPALSLDLLRALALLHDIGKAEAYTWAVAIDLTNAGCLLDHIVLGLKIVDQAIAELPGFPPALRLRLLHALAAHHGAEGGSPVRPQTLEAVALHELDMLDARIGGWLDHAAAQPTAAEWTTYCAMFSSRLFRGDGPDEARTSPPGAAADESEDDEWLRGP